MDIFVLENKQNNISGSSSTTTNIITAIIIMMEEISPSLQKMSFRRWKPELRKKNTAQQFCNLRTIFASLNSIKSRSVIRNYF